MKNETNSEKGHFKVNWMKYTFLLFVVSIIGYQWIDGRSSKLKMKKAFAVEKMQLQDSLENQIMVLERDDIELITRNFSWAVRGEMIRGNQDQIEQYFNQLVKSDKVLELLYLDNKNNVLVATNKKKEGKELSNSEMIQHIGKEELFISENEVTIISSIPVMSFDSKLGTLIMVLKRA